MNMESVVTKIFPGLDARARGHLAAALEHLPADPTLREIAKAKPTAIDEMTRREAQTTVLLHLFTRLVGAEPDEDMAASLRHLALAGKAAHAVAMLLHAASSGGPTHVRETVDALFAEYSASTASPDPSGASPPAEPPTPPSPAGSHDPPRKDSAMALSFNFDSRNIPRDLATDPDKQGKYVATIRDTVARRGLDPKNDILVAAVVGGLLRQGQFDPASLSIPQFVGKITDALLIQKKAPSGDPFNGVDIYNAIAAALLKNASNGSNGSGTSTGTAGTGAAASATVSYQLFSYVGDEVTKTIDRVPVAPKPDPNFGARVQAAVLAYASGAVGYEDLQLPDLETATDTEIVPENIQACGMMYAAYQLELAKLIPVLDIVSDLYDDGLIPIAFDDAGLALDDYRFTEYERIGAAKRASYFSRVFGLKGADVPKTVQPNAQFDTLMMRFVSTVAEYERVRDLAQTWGQTGGGPGGVRPGAITSEHVRKAGRELAANLSLYGWGSAHRVARRMNTHIKQALDILGLTQVQQAFGASNVWQVIERVSQQELKMTPNVVKFRTMAEAGKKVLDVIARNPSVWKSADQDVFDALGTDKDILLGNARYWLTVNGVTDSTLDQMSQNVEMANSPSLPSMNGSKSSADGAMNQLRSMISAGQTPSMDQLQHLLVN